MHQSIVAYRNIVAQGGAGALIGAMDHRTVLDVHTVAKADTVHIATHNGIEPDAAFIAHFHITNNGRILCQITVSAKFWGDTFYGFDKGHVEETGKWEYWKFDEVGGWPFKIEQP